MKNTLLLSAAAVAVLATAGFAWRESCKERRLSEARISKAQRKRNQVASSANEVLAEAEVDEGLDAFITRATFTELKNALETRRVTAEHIIVSLARRLRKIGLTLNAVVGVTFEQALATARQFDSGQRQGVLAGLPLSVEDSFQQENFSSTFGLVSLAYNTQSSDGLILKELKSQGAIPLVRSATSEGGISLETVSKLWGRCSNPWNTKRSVPGTSGGAATLVATGCIPVALVSDFGGGATLSALNTGVYSLMPTPSRGSTRGLLNPLDSESESWFINLKPSVGGIARSVDDLALLVKGLWENHADKMIPHIPFNDTTYESQQPIKIGVITGDHGFTLPKTTLRALDLVKAALESKAEVSEVSASWLVQVKSVFDNWVGYGGYAEKVRKHDSSAKTKGLFSTLGKFFEKREGSPGSIIRDSLDLDAYNFFIKHRSVLDHFRDLTRDLLFEYDVIILPSLLCPAWPPNHGSELEPHQASTVLSSLFYLPCGVVPVTTVRADEQVYAATNPETKGIETNLQGSQGLPVGVIVLSRPYFDEVVLRVMKQLEASLEFENSPVLS